MIELLKRKEHNLEAKRERYAYLGGAPFRKVCIELKVIRELIKEYDETIHSRR